MASASPIDFRLLMGPVARRLLGEPNAALSTSTDLRYGAKGSLSVDLTKGTFFDHEANVGGGVIELVVNKRGGNQADAVRWLRRESLLPLAGDDGPPASTFYDYADADGAIVYRVERRGKRTVPPFLQHGPDGRGGFHPAKGCMGGVARLPYRLPQLLAADRDAIVYVCEGEKDADRLAGLGLIATTNSGGAGKFVDELVPHFAGRRVAILADNDQAGEAHAVAVAEKLTGTAVGVAIIRLPNLPAKGDVSDWLALGGSAGALADLAEAELMAPIAAPATFAIADLASWAKTAATPTPFYMAGHIPTGEVTLLTGAGGGNKSTFGQQLATCSAAGRPMLGIEVQRGAALYVTCEDHDDRLHWMQEHICRALGVDMAGLAGRLHLASIRGRLGNELATFDQDGRLKPSPTFTMLRATIESTRAELLVLDNVAHLFAGNENDRGQVTAFVNLLYALCGELGVTILLIAHRNKAGDTYSGSTAWLNAVRSQLVIERPEGDPDADARVLSIGKANYARPDQQLAFRWHDFALIRDDELAPDERDTIAASAAAGAENAAFLACLDAATARRQAVSHVPGVNYAPKLFASMVEARHTRQDALARAMERLLHLGLIALEQPLWRGANRHWKQGIARAPSCANPPAPTPCADPRQPLGQAIVIAAPTLRAPTPLGTTYLPGAGSDGPPAPASGMPGRPDPQPVDHSASPPPADDAAGVAALLRRPLPDRLRDPFNPEHWPEDDQ